MDIKASIEKVRVDTDRDMITTLVADGRMTGLFGKQEKTKLTIQIDEKSLNTLRAFMALPVDL